jgi:phosphatidylethanolamine N-methyltransferase
MSTAAEFASTGDAVSALRERKKTAFSDAEPNALGTESQAEQDNSKEEQVTWGRTPDGTGIHSLGGSLTLVFKVPQTHDVLSSIFNPSKPKSFLDVLVLAVLALQIGLLILLPSSIRRPTSLALFLFWRAAYDLGLGYLLNEQSVRRALIRWAKDYKIFDPNHNPRRYAFIRRQLSDKMGDDYNFDTSPIEYNTWLLFRRLVDLILVNDFVSYALFAISWIHHPSGHGWAVHTLRWSAGWVLAFFNIWVKMDAHRVVKDFAWCMSISK